MWTDIIEIAREHWRWVITQSYARTHQGRDGRQRAGEVDQSGTCLVAILFVPSNTGAYFFLSTIPRPTKQREMRARAYRDAIAWWNAVVLACLSDDFLSNPE
ncbi:hypothetical protein QBC46DRAFT_388057 [Diplogelasinospora grovesii]|uniref:Uncharacterized protein n=1 Tax=Diplogelasinospora grovesii TaxID=303347 RepID=A0AAN6S4C0_9PEZI|nr:hypothetical protein QBC46DRAFT_388057 [Diplogelasinospora grovesii]